MIYIETVSGCSTLDRFKLPYSPMSIWIPHTGAVLKVWPNKCLVGLCLCFYMGLSCANSPLYKTKNFIGFDVVNVSIPF